MSDERPVVVEQWSATLKDFERMRHASEGMLRVGQRFRFKGDVSPDGHYHLVGEVRPHANTGEPIVELSRLTFDNHNILAPWTETREGGWTRKSEKRIDSSAPPEWMRLVWIVEEAKDTADQKVTGMSGFPETYPGGHMVVAVAESPINGHQVRVTFYQSGSFRGQWPPGSIEILENPSPKYRPDIRVGRGDERVPDDQPMLARVSVSAEDVVEICKDLGPSVAYDIRVRCDLGRKQWVVEMTKEVPVAAPTFEGETETAWVEVAAIGFMATEQR